jgi:hypothetical protein
MVAYRNDREDEALAIDEIVTGMRPGHRSATSSRAKAHTDFNALQVARNR